MADGDLLHYCDAGCWLNHRGKNRLLEYFDALSREESGILAFQAKNLFGDPLLDTCSYPEYKWTKGDLRDHFGVRRNEAILLSGQISATSILFRKCQPAANLVQRWLNTYQESFALADGSVSVSENISGFVSHRHDQSIFGILCKTNGIRTLSAFELWYPCASDPNKPDWNKLRSYPVWARRDKNSGWFGPLGKLNALRTRLSILLRTISGRVRRQG